jgi:hypothetical protein
METPDWWKPGEKVELVVRGVVEERGYLQLEDGTIWNFLPKAAEVCRVESDV